MNDVNDVNEVVALFANFLNYLNVSLYEAQMTQKHEKARASINSIYEEVSQTPQNQPTLNQCILFYSDLLTLEHVTYTDDPDYFSYKRLLRKYIASQSSSSTPE
jgi:hypothetical protein